MKILIVDNDPAASKLLTSALSQKGHEIVEALNGRDALEMMARKPAAVITAATLPDMDGCALCRQIREAEIRPYVYIVMLSQDPPKQERIKSLFSGADVCIAKPTDPDELDAQLKAGIRIIGNKEHLDATIRAAKPKPIEMPITALPATAKKDSIRIGDTTKHDRVLAQIALTNKILTKKDLAEAFTIQLKEKTAGRKTTLDEILLVRGMVAPAIREDLLVAVKRRLGKRFGAIAIQKGFAAQEQVAMGLAEQAEEYKRFHSCRRLGDILVAKAVITEEQRDLIWLEQEAFEVIPTESKQPLPEQIVDDPEENHGSNPFTLMISADAMTARILRKGDATAKGTLAQIKTLLEENKIKHGIIPDDQIMLFLDNPDENQPHFIIAKGVPPVPGTDASIQFHFSTDYLIAGKISADGDIDYKDRGDRPRVAKGDVLAEKKPFKPGQAGMDILGNIIAIPEPEDVQISCEEGAELSPDGLKVIALIDGEPNVTKAGRISVFDELAIKGDVDFSTGNIHFNGNIKIKGAIHDGFRVSGGNISANEIFGAEIEAAGDVTVAGGILGAKILTEGNVSAKYIDHANIKSFGNVTVQKEVRDSKIRASGEFKSETGAIISSYVAAKLGIKAKNIGTDVSEPCKIQIGIDENVRKRIQAYGFRHAEQTLILEKLQNEYESRTQNSQAIQDQIAQLAQVQDRAIMAQRSLSNQVAELKQQGKTDELKQALLEMRDLEAKSLDAGEELNKYFREQERVDVEASKFLTEIETIIAGIEAIGNEKKAVIKWSEKNKAQAVLRATGTLFSGTKIHGRRSALTLKEDVRNAVVREVKTDEEADYWEIAITRG